MLDQREFNKILGAIKRIFSRSNHRRSVLNKALSKKVGVRGGRMYTCKSCKKAHPAKDVQVDHIKPVVPLDKAALSMSWDVIIERLYCNPRNLQVLCRDCHKKKSKLEAKERARLRRENTDKDRKD